MLYDMLWTCVYRLYHGLVECVYGGLFGFCCCYSICHDVNFSFAFLLLFCFGVYNVPGILRDYLLKSEVLLITALQCFISDFHAYETSLT